MKKGTNVTNVKITDFSVKHLLEVCRINLLGKVKGKKNLEAINSSFVELQKIIPKNGVDDAVSVLMEYFADDNNKDILLCELKKKVESRVNKEVSSAARIGCFFSGRGMIKGCEDDARKINVKKIDNPELEFGEFNDSFQSEDFKMFLKRGEIDCFVVDQEEEVEENESKNKKNDSFTPVVPIPADIPATVPKKKIELTIKETEEVKKNTVETDEIVPQSVQINISKPVPVLPKPKVKVIEPKGMDDIVQQKSMEEKKSVVPGFMRKRRNNSSSSKSKTAGRKSSTIRTGGFKSKKRKRKGVKSSDRKKKKRKISKVKFGTGL